jgi:hypothetical protein
LILPPEVKPPSDVIGSKFAAILFSFILINLLRYQTR